MPIPVKVSVPRLAIVGNARLRGLDLLPDTTPLNMHHERTSEDMLPDYVRHPGYIAVGSRLARAAADARNSALNASA